MADGHGRPIKVLHLISTLDVGGAEQNLLRLVASMNRDLFANEVVCMTVPGPLGSRLEQTGTPVRSLGMRKDRPEVGAVLKLRFLTRLFQPDVIQCWMYHANLLGMTLLSPRKLLWNIRCSDMDLVHYSPLYRFTVRAGARLSGMPAAVITNSVAGRSAHEKIGYRPKKWFTIPNGFDTDIFKPDAQSHFAMRAKLRIPQHAFVIGIIGRMDPMKDHSTFFRATRLFLASHPGTHFILAGRGIAHGNQDMNVLMQGLPDSGTFHLLGERSDMPQILATLDMLTSSSVSEGFPNAIGEAMACGVPCAATDAGDTGALMGDTGILVRKRSPEDLCNAWDAIARMKPEDRLALGSRARERIMQHFTQDRTTGLYEQIYQEIVKA
ncbi:MAG: glycosyltransferase [Desulfobacterota bacterium]|nr:glycosyltransferase [Thermodesulfobacteriota bacterium]